MLRLRIIHHLRTFAFLAVLMLILGAIGTLLWANITGMPKSWRQAVERAIAEHGIHVEIGALSYNPLQGITARQVKVFASEDRKEVISRLEGIILDLDNAKLAKGEVQLAKIKLSKARLILPVDPDNPNSELLEIDNIQGEFIPPGNRHIEIRNARGRIAGIDLILNAKIADDLTHESGTGEGSNHKDHREFMAKLIRELRQWSFDPEAPPQIRIQCIGKRSEMDQLKATISFHAKSIEKNNHTIEQLEAEAELHENLLAVRAIKAKNGSRILEAHVDYDLKHQHGRFDFESSLEIPELLESWFGMDPLTDIAINGDQQLKASGEFQLTPGESPSIHATGHTFCKSGTLKDIRFDEIQSDFSWRNGDLFLKDITLIRPDGIVRGKALIQPNLVRIDLHSTLLPEFYRPLFLGKGTETIIDNFTTNPDSRMELWLEGGYDRRDLLSWAYAGKVALSNITYRGVDLASAHSDLSVSSSQMDFANGSMEFDYSNYNLAKRFKGPSSGSLKYDSVRYRRDAGRQVSFTGLEGNFWPAPLCRMFLDKTADHLEKYGFHRPPQITATGSIDLEHKKDTRIDVEFTSASHAEYVLLNTPITMTNPKGKVVITDERVDVNQLEIGIFEGRAGANLGFPKGQPMTVDIDAKKLSMDAINSAYGLKMKSGGYLNSIIEFKMMPGKTSTMAGKGNMKLTQAELFSVPIFGPLSGLLQTILSDKRVGSERAKEASCSFLIKNGVVASNDFTTSTTSLVFAGDGWVDLNKKTMEMTMRMNARGLLGLLTIPLRPFYGMFQFRGTGPLNKPEWKRVMFTKPQDEIHKLLLKTPSP